MQARKASVLVIGAMAAVAIGGAVALASSGGDDDTTPSRAAVVDALGGEPTPSPSAEDQPRGDDRAGGDDRAATGLGVAEAKAIAVGAAGGGRVTKIERETEHGRAVWDVEVIRGGVEHDIDVDRRTGAVLRHRIDHD
ncbi:MAG TPA: PepSY domain-containing protein [Actinoplanes sp.]|nr:PepSY domain-containing protein [Actinoplanes sp.]